MPAILKTVQTEAVKVANLIKSRETNSRLFSILCNEMGSEHDKLLLRTEVSWLSRGNVLSRLFDYLNFVQKCKFFSPTSLQTYAISSLMKCGFLDWPTWQIYFAVSMSLIRAYRVSVLHHSQSTTKQNFQKHTWFHYQRSRKWTNVLLSIFGQFYE
jgi:hypothetical protein